MSPQTQEFLTRLAEVNAVLKMLTGSEEAKVLSAAVPGAAQVVADLEVGEELISLITTVVPIIDTLSGAWTAGPASVEAVDAIYATRAVGDGA